MAEAGAYVVVGGTRGVGAAVAERLATTGTPLVLNHLQDRDSAAALKARLEGDGARVTLVEGNIADRRVRDALVASVADLGGACRGFVHSVAVTSFKPLTAIRANQWDLVLAVSARSLLEVAVALREPLARARGAIVTISSLGAVRHVPDYGALGPAKAALEAVVRDLAVAFGPHGIRVNAVRAGLVESEVAARLPRQVAEMVAGRTPLGRVGRPQDIAATVCCLLGGDMPWVTGQVLDVDGGYSIT